MASFVRVYDTVDTAALWYMNMKMRKRSLSDEREYQLRDARKTMTYSEAGSISYIK